MAHPSEILAGLAEIANDAIGLAIAWHLAAAAALVAGAMGWRPSRRLARTLLALPLASVAVLAVLFGNPFNALVLGTGTVALIALAGRGEAAVVRSGRSWTVGAGTASLTLGWVYPHFLDAHPAAYLVAAPMGLLPCPTLSAVIGGALVAGTVDARPWSLALAALGGFYALFGVLRLGVLLDVGLLVAASALLAATLTRAPSSAPPSRGLRRRR